MEIRIEDKNLLDFFATIKTSSLIEERIKLMLGDSTIKSIIFKNGQLNKGLRGNIYEDIANWKLSFEETLQFMFNISEKLEEYTQQQDLKHARIWFKDHFVTYDFVENKNHKDLEERLIFSTIELQIIDLVYIRSEEVHQDDLPF